jgi:hypothetical protein
MAYPFTFAATPAGVELLHVVNVRAAATAPRKIRKRFIAIPIVAGGVECGDLVQRKA